MKMSREETTARTIHTALFPNMPWEEQCKEVKDEMFHAARKVIHVLALGCYVASNRELLSAMWEDVTTDPHNLAVIMPRFLFDELTRIYMQVTQGAMPEVPLTLINVPPMFAEQLQVEDELDYRPKGVIRRWLERISR